MDTASFQLRFDDTERVTSYCAKVSPLGPAFALPFALQVLRMPVSQCLHWLNSTAAGNAVSCNAPGRDKPFEETSAGDRGHRSRFRWPRWGQPPATRRIRFTVLLVLGSSYSRPNTPRSARADNHGYACGDPVHALRLRRCRWQARREERGLDCLACLESIVYGRLSFRNMWNRRSFGAECHFFEASACLAPFRSLRESFQTSRTWATHSEMR